VVVVIAALAHLPDGLRRTVVFAGTDEGRGGELLRLAERLGVAELVRLTGWLADEQLRELYAGSIASVSASTYEGYGLPVAESLSYGLPTIASDIPPHREVGAGAALFFRPGDATGLAACMRRVIEEASLRESLGRQALERSHELAQLGPRWSDVILEALRGAQSPPET
jgi:glycosyltransferase involved in cell wall biosynthesis